VTALTAEGSLRPMVSATCQWSPRYRAGPTIASGGMALAGDQLAGTAVQRRVA
jgi:hypothetical protein